MLRTVVSVIAGYVAMVIVVFTVLTGAYFTLGADRSFQPGTYDVTGLWLAIMLAVDVLAGAAGALVCLAIAPGKKAARALMVLVAVLGILSAIPAFLPPPEGTPTVRDESVGNLEAMSNARQPGWIAILHPLIGVATIWGVTQRRRPASAVSEQDLRVDPSAVGH